VTEDFFSSSFGHLSSRFFTAFQLKWNSVAFYFVFTAPPMAIDAIIEYLIYYFIADIM